MNIENAPLDEDPYMVLGARLLAVENAVACLLADLVPAAELWALAASEAAGASAVLEPSEGVTLHPMARTDEVRLGALSKRCAAALYMLAVSLGATHVGDA